MIVFYIHREKRRSVNYILFSPGCLEILVFVCEPIVAQKVATDLAKGHASSSVENHRRALLVDLS
jgi:hypothetical protein